MPFQCFRDSRVAKEVCAIDKEIFSIFPFRDVISDVSSPFWFAGKNILYRVFVQLFASFEVILWKET